MTTATAEPETINGQVIQYVVTDAAIEALRKEFATVSFDNPKNYAVGVKALAEVRTLRTWVEKKRVELKADAVAWGRKVDAEAKRVTGLLLAMEEPLKEKKAAVDEAKERAEREAKEAAWRAEQERLLAERRAEEEKLKAEREQLAAARAEQERIAAEQRKVADDQAAERRKIEAERYALDGEKRRQAREDADRLAKILDDEERAAKVERDRIAAEQAKILEAERKAAEAKRLEALKPDLEKLAGFGEVLWLWAQGAAPECKSPEATKMVVEALFRIEGIKLKLQEFKGFLPVG
jgi:hypothetical protein